MSENTAEKEEKEHVKWSDTYSVGIQLIDSQHQGLIEFVNDLYNHSTGNEQEEHIYFDSVIQKALDYVKTHFLTEEKCMRATDFPGYGEHKRIHDEFTFTVIKSVNEFKTGNKLVLEKFAGFIKDWIFNHIAVMDKQFYVFYRKTGNLKSNGKMSPVLEEAVKSMTPR